VQLKANIGRQAAQTLTPVASASAPEGLSAPSGGVDICSSKGVCIEGEMAFSVRIGEFEGGPVLEVAGDADSAVVPELELAFKQAEAKSSEVVFVDLREIKFIDSRVMSVLESWNSQLRGEGRRMAVVCVNEDILRLFSLIGLTREFSFYPDLESAAVG
jgi:anti-anti-sigma factor